MIDKNFNFFYIFRYSLRTVDIAQPSIAPQPTDIKFQRGGIRWQQLNYSYQVSLTLWLPKEKTTQALYKLFVVRILMNFYLNLCLNILNLVDRFFLQF